MQIPFSKKNGKIIFGFYAGRTHSIVEFNKCKVGFEGSNEILTAIKLALEEYNISIYDEKTNTGIFREVMLRRGNNSKEVFNMQEKKFVENKLGDNYIQLYFEEAHNLFPPQTKILTDVYSRFAKEGAKFHIGMIYSTQSPSTISKELLVQTENFFIGHLSSVDEAYALSKLQVAYSGIENDILKARTPGFMRMLTMSNRFVIPVQTELYNPNKEN